MKRIGLGLVLLVGALGLLRGGETIPPPPANHFNDYAGVVRADAAARLDAELTQYERDSSNQIVVAIYPTMQSDSSVEDYTVRIAQSWHVGLKGRDNGAVLFIFMQPHRIYVQVGYGLEGALPDARCKEIISQLISPAFRQGDYTLGVTDGVHALLAAAKGEYHGTGSTVRERRQSSGHFTAFAIFWILAVLVISVVRRRAAVYGGGGRWGSGPFIFTGGGGGGGFGGGGGGSFSGGGGSFGGGGAGGSW